MTLEDKCYEYSKNPNKEDWIKLFYEFEPSYEEVRRILTELGVPKKMMFSRTKQMRNFLPNIREQVRLYESGVKTPEMIGDEFGLHRTTIQWILSVLGKLKTISEARNCLYQRKPELRNLLSEKSKIKSEENIRMYGSAVPYRDSETGVLTNISKTSTGKETLKRISSDRIRKYGVLMPCMDSDGNLKPYFSTEEGRKKAWTVYDESSGERINYRKTAEGRRKSSESARANNDISLHDSNIEDLYIIEALSVYDNNVYIKVGRSTDFLNKRKWAYLNSSSIFILDAYLYSGYGTSTLESEFHSKNYYSIRANHFEGKDSSIAPSEWYEGNSKDIIFEYFEKLGITFKRVKLFY